MKVLFTLIAAQISAVVFASKFQESASFLSICSLVSFILCSILLIFNVINLKK